MTPQEAIKYLVDTDESFSKLDAYIIGFKTLSRASNFEIDLSSIDETKSKVEKYALLKNKRQTARDILNYYSKHEEDDLPLGWSKSSTSSYTNGSGD